MCLILFAYHSHPTQPLIIAANRDETYSRPTRNAQFWPESPELLAGKDLQAGGLWLGINRKGRFAAITNFRDPKAKTGSLSRGLIGKEFLMSKEQPEKFLIKLSENAEIYSGFNLLLGDQHNLYYYSNREKQISKLKPGVYGLSNHLLNASWPKIAKGKELLSSQINSSNKKPILTENLITLLNDKTRPEDELLPDTGVGLDYERVLSPMFIQTPVYGTRSSTALTISQEGKVNFHEQCYAADGIETERVQIDFEI